MVYHICWSATHQKSDLSLTEFLSFLCDQKYLSSRMNLIFSRPFLRSRILAGMMVDVVRMLPVPRVKKTRERQGTCHGVSSLEQEDLC